MMKLSIITATYNSEKTLERCLRSVKTQSANKYIEHIVIDGASNDSTLEIIAGFPHIAKVISEKDNGIYDAFNKGLREASGEFVYYLNSDDWLLSENIVERVLGELSKETGFLCAKVMMQDDVTKAKWLHNPRTFEYKDKTFPIPNHQGFIINRNWMLRKGGFDERYTVAADTEMMIDVMLTSQGEFLDFPIACFEHGGTTTNAVNTELVREQLDEVFRLKKVQVKREFENANLYKNTKYFKNILHDLLSEKPLSELIKGKKVSIFGTGQLAVIISKILELRGVKVESYVTSSGEPKVFNSKPVLTPESIQNIPIINTVEGEHYKDVDFILMAENSKASIVHWFEIYDS